MVRYYSMMNLIWLASSGRDAAKGEVGSNGLEEFENVPM